MSGEQFVYRITRYGKTYYGSKARCRGFFNSLIGDKYARARHPEECRRRMEHSGVKVERAPIPAEWTDITGEFL